MAKDYNYKNHFNISEAMNIHNTTVPGTKFTLLDFNILCLVKSFYKSGRQCYISNKQLAEQLLSHESTIRRSIDRLCDAQFLKKEYIGGNRNNGRYLIYQKDKVDTFIAEMHSMIK